MRCYRKNEFMKRADFLHVHSGAIIFCLTENPTLPLRHKNLGVHCSFICFGFVSFVLILGKYVSRKKFGTNQFNCNFCRVNLL